MSDILSASSRSLIINTLKNKISKSIIQDITSLCNGHLRSGWEFLPTHFTPTPPPLWATKQQNYKNFSEVLAKNFCFCNHKTEVLPPGRTFALRALQYGAGGVWVGALVSGRWRRRSLLRQSGAASCTRLRSQRQGGGRSRGRSWKSDEMTWLVEKQVRPERTGTQGQRQHSHHLRSDECKVISKSTTKIIKKTTANMVAECRCGPADNWLDKTTAKGSTFQFSLQANSGCGVRGCFTITKGQPQPIAHYTSPRN